MSDPVILRAMVPGDLPYVFSTWLRDLRDADSSGLPDDLWFPAYRALVERILGDRTVLALVAAAADAPTEILGYVVCEPEAVLEWVFVRKKFRQKGLAKRLLQAVGATPGITARAQTPASRKRLQVQLRSRDLRREKPRTSPTTTAAGRRSAE